MFRDPSGKFLLVDASGKFDMAKYQERVGDVAVFERGVAEDIAREKLEAFVTAGVHVSEDDSAGGIQAKEHRVRSNLRGRLSDASWLRRFNRPTRS